MESKKIEYNPQHLKHLKKLKFETRSPTILPLNYLIISSESLEERELTESVETEKLSQLMGRYEQSKQMKCSPGFSPKTKD